MKSRNAGISCTRIGRKWKDSNGWTIVFHASSIISIWSFSVSYTYTFWVRLTSSFTCWFGSLVSICHINTVQIRGDSSISSSSSLSATWYIDQPIWLVTTESTAFWVFIPCKKLKRQPRKNLWKCYCDFLVVHMVILEYSNIDE